MELSYTPALWSFGINPVAFVHEEVGVWAKQAITSGVGMQCAVSNMLYAI